MMDLAVINGLVFIEGGFRKADVGIKDGKFALIAEPGCLPEAERTIDAGGKYVLPGGIDTHVHYRDPGHWERETFEVGTRAAASDFYAAAVERRDFKEPYQHLQR